MYTNLQGRSWQCFTDVPRTITFPDRRFPDKMFPGQSLSRTRRFSERRFPDKTFPGQDLSRTITFPDRRFPDKTFPGQVILRNFHVHNVCKCQLYRPSHTIYRYTERLLMCSRRWPRTVKKISHFTHQLTSPHKHTDFMNATAVSGQPMVSINEQLNSADWVGLKWLCDAA